jgi:exopolysaccharide production protein ExoQ
MHQILAFLFCTAFVVLLLSFDRKQTRNASYALWIPTIWMLLAASKPLGIWFGMGDEGGDAEGSSLDRIVLMGILLLGLLVLASRRLPWSSIVRRNSWLFVLVGYALVSTLWSDLPFISIRRWARELIAVVMALVVLTEQDPRQGVETVLRRTTYLLIPYSLLLIKYFPQYGVEYGRWDGELMWLGVTVQKNGLGRICLISIFFLVWALLRRRRGREKPASRYQTPAELLLAVAAFWLLIGGGVGAYSATAVAALIAGLIMLFSLQWAGKRNSNVVCWFWVAAIVAAFVFGAVLPLVAAGGSVDSVVTGALGRNQTLTGRTDIWAKLVPYFELRPILGYGFGGFWTAATQAVAYGIKEAHNGYLASFLELGIIGVLLIGAFLWSVVRRSQRALAYDADFAMLCLCFVLMLVIHNISEASINSFQRHLTATLLFISVAVSAAFPKKSRQRGPSINAARIPSDVAARQLPATRLKAH